MMSKTSPVGIHDIFIPRIDEGEMYKFQVKTVDGFCVDKTDPFGFTQQQRPETASIVVDLDKHVWKDKEWMERNSYIQNAVSLGIFFLPLTLNSANLVRVVQYYSIFLLVFVGHVVRTGDFKRNILLYNTVRYVLVGVLTYKLLTTPADYAFFWQDMIITNN